MAARFLALGDSYTVGEAVAPADSWPHRVADGLAGLGWPTDVKIVATTGWTAGELVSALIDDPPVGRYDVVSLSIGVNDQYRGLELARYEAALDDLLDISRAMMGPGGGRFAVSIPDWGVTPYAQDRDRRAVARDIDRFNRAFSTHVDAAGFSIVDVTELSRRFPDEVADDGLHPSGRHYARWAERILPVAVGILEGAA